MDVDASVPKTCRLFSLIGQLIYVLASLATVVTFVPIELTQFKVSDSDFHMSLFRCTDCDDGTKAFSYSCFDKIYCENDIDGLCDMGKLQQLNASVYAGLAAFGVLCQLLIIERLGAMRNKLDYGHVKLMWGILFIGWASTVTAGIFWIVNGEIKFGGSCSTDDPKSSVDICASPGAYLIPSAMGLSTIGLIFAALAMKKRNPTHDEGIRGVANGIVAGLSHRKWLLKIAFAQVAAVVFIGMSMNWRWVHYNDTSLDSKYYGKLLVWEDFESFPYENLGHNCVHSVYCNKDSDDPFCKGFKKLDKASQLFLAFEVCALLCIVFWLEHVLYLLMKREFGFVKLNYFWAPMSFVFHTCAFATYVAVSEVSFGAKCDFDYDSTSLDFCAEQGPQFIMWSMICLTFGALFSDLIYLRRYVRGMPQEDKDLKTVTYKSENAKKIESFELDTSLNGTRSGMSAGVYSDSPVKKQGKTGTVVPILEETVGNVDSPLHSDSCVRCGKPFKNLKGIAQLDCGHAVHDSCLIGDSCPMCDRSPMRGNEGAKASKRAK
mmetsp:Transcript_26195/g.46730  ORF Transcript_26195/g.46730 Transcript_26195/m.46730 type:complete len:547 (-) Transcript_26195:4793-6433(-)